MGLAEYITEVQADSPHNFWELQETGSPTEFADTGSANEPLDTLSGTYTPGAAGPGGALAVDFQGGKISNNDTILTEAGGWAVEWWVQLDAFAGIVCNPEGPNATFDWQSGVPQMRIVYQGVAILGASATAFNLTDFFQIAWCQTAGGLNKLIVNGVQDSTFGFTSPSAGGPGFSVGAFHTGIAQLFGRAALISTYDAEVSTARFLAHYNALLAATNISPPVASGTTVVGGTVTSTDGTWTGSPTFTYQWQHSADGMTGWTNIGGATSASYLISPLYENEFLKCVVTADGTVDVDSNVLGPVGVYPSVVRFSIIG